MKTEEFNPKEEMNELSSAIAKAINPLAPYKLPMVALLLDRYSLAIKSNKDFSQSVYDYLQEAIGTVAVGIPCGTPEYDAALEELMRAMEGR